MGPRMIGHMVSYLTWERFIRESDGSVAMKEIVIGVVNAVVREGDLIDSFKLGYTLGGLSSKLSGDSLADFYKTIKLTRDLNNVPIVRRHGEPVS
jgi:hypothetical protein